MEQFLATVWAEVLSLPEAHASDDFFALGGHSFAATRVMARIDAALGCRVPVRVLFATRVLRDFAAEVERLALQQLSDEASA